MVKVREEIPRREDGRIDISAWTGNLTREHGRLEPDRVLAACEFVDSLPKTRSGKIMRRLLKARAQGLPEGDTSTLED